MKVIFIWPQIMLSQTQADLVVCPLKYVYIICKQKWANEIYNPTKWSEIIVVPRSVQTTGNVESLVTAGQQAISLILWQLALLLPVIIELNLNVDIVVVISTVILLFPGWKNLKTTFKTCFYESWTSQMPEDMSYTCILWMEVATKHWTFYSWEYLVEEFTHYNVVGCCWLKNYTSDDCISWNSWGGANILYKA